jgi:hypothetical protein
MIVSSTIAQTSNEDRLKELPTLIEEAGSNKDYKLAAKLEDELAIRKDLKQAVDEEDYKTATTLREDLYDLESGNYNRNKTNEEAAEIDEDKEENKIDNSIFYLDFGVAGINMYDFTRSAFVETYDQSGNYTGVQEQQIPESHNMYSINFKLGHKFYFGPGARKFRIGIDVNYLSLNLGLNLNDEFILPNIAFSTPSPGFVMTYHINDNMGLDFQTNVGIMFMLSEFNDLPLPTPGIAINPQLRFWYNKLGIGLQYIHHRVNTLNNINNFTLNHAALFVGLRF